VQFHYDEKMPLRILDEGDFWKLQESEHTIVLRELVPNLEEEFVQALSPSGSRRFPRRRDCMSATSRRSSVPATG
jgi:hypothetical protein